MEKFNETGNERCWFVFGRKLGHRYIGWLKYHSEGSPASVAFNWEDALRGKLIGFLHTHPSGVYYPSSTDIRTMRGWVKAEGRPIMCFIKCDGITKCFCFRREPDSSIAYLEYPCKVIGNLIFTYNPKDK